MAASRNASVVRDVSASQARIVALTSRVMSSDDTRATAAAAATANVYAAAGAADWVSRRRANHERTTKLPCLRRLYREHRISNPKACRSST